MAAVFNLAGGCGRRCSAPLPPPRITGFSRVRVSIRPQDGESYISRLSQNNARLKCSVSRRSICTCMALIDRRVIYQPEVTKPAEVLAYHLVQGDLTARDKSIGDTPTAVLLHGILGSRKNWGSFAKRLAQEFPTWQFLLVDLRCHGDSASIKKRGPNTVASAARDVLNLVNYNAQEAMLDLNQSLVSCRGATGRRGVCKAQKMFQKSLRPHKASFRHKCQV